MRTQSLCSVPSFISGSASYRGTHTLLTVAHTPTLPSLVWRQRLSKLAGAASSLLANVNRHLLLLSRRQRSDLPEHLANIRPPTSPEGPTQAPFVPGSVGDQLEVFILCHPEDKRGLMSRNKIWVNNPEEFILSSSSTHCLTCCVSAAEMAQKLRTLETFPQTEPESNTSRSLLWILFISSGSWTVGRCRIFSCRRGSHSFCFARWLFSELCWWRFSVIEDLVNSK